MPTARELLEEVDALMRRNRSGEAGPVEPMPAATPSAADADDGEAVPDPASTADTADAQGTSDLDAQHDPAAAPGVERGAAALDATEDDIPVLTDVAGADGGGRPGAGVIATSSGIEDFPLLTDAVDDIAAPDIVRTSVEDGPGSDGGDILLADTPDEWREPSGIAGDDSVAAPDEAGSSEAEASLAADGVQPAAEAHAATAAAAAVGSDARSDGEHRAHDTDARDAASPGETFEFDRAVLEAAFVAGHGGEPSHIGASVADDAQRFAEAPAIAAPAPAAQAEQEQRHAAETELDDWLREQAAHNAAAVGTLASVTDTAPSLPGAGASPTSNDAPTAPAMQAPLDADDPRWASLAEEIRVQVLQRVDLFTEAGLQSQLQQHLQPIVDRASAELVATINRQLGQLLRAYVAEAIEREIEKWRSSGG